MAISVLLFALVVVSDAPAQSAQEHAAHHPSGDSVVQPRAVAQSRPPKPVADMMAQMMEQMMAPPPLEVVPALMRLPALTAEDRSELARMAAERMLVGAARLGSAIDRLAAAEEGARYAEMTAALDEARQGLALMESAVSARTALDAESAPAEVAERWLLSEMSLPSGTTLLGRQRGISPFHVVLMTILLFFSATMLVIHLRRVRAVESLLAEAARAPQGASAGSAQT